MGKRIVIQKGERYGRLTVLRDLGEKGARRRIELSCDCGNVVQAALHDVRCGDTRSCGCLKSEKAEAQGTTHGLRFHEAYYAWKNMRMRCSKGYRQSKDYYDKGIRVCDEWSTSPVEFCKWAESAGFEKGLQLDRIDNNLTGSRAYSPENCRWASRDVNNQNTSRSYWWYCNGVAYESGSLLANAIGMKYASVVYRCKSESFPEMWRELKYKQAT